MQTLDGAPLPILSWAPELEEGAVQQARHCAALPVAYHHVAVMADGHQGYGVPIGAVLPLEDAISPYAVGNDIGCGMALVPTRLHRDDLLAARDDIMDRIQSTIPAGMGAHRDARPGGDVDGLLNAAFDAMEEASAACGIPLSTSQAAFVKQGDRPLTRHAFVERGRSQAGTLGSGNHFIELLAGPDGDVWLMLHSGSRGVGGLVCNNFHRMALGACEAVGEALPDPGLAWLPMRPGSDDIWARVGSCYEQALRAALAYAEQNRHCMLEAVAAIVARRFPDPVDWDGTVNIHHNDATLEEHYGRQVWVHRKGAVKAGAGTSTVTPGSMGTGSYLGRGLGNPQSFSSCSHGAGRRMSRGRAREQLSLPDELDRIQAAGGKVFAESKGAVLDEMPGAYKDLDAVMAAQADLVETVRRFTPLATYKGVDRPSRRRKKGWRPEEER